MLMKIDDTTENMPVEIFHMLMNEKLQQLFGQILMGKKLEVQFLKKSIGYPTQKPERILERILSVSQILEMSLQISLLVVVRQEQPR